MKDALDPFRKFNAQESAVMENVVPMIQDHLREEGIRVGLLGIITILRSKHKYKCAKAKMLSTSEKLRKWARVKANNRNAEVHTRLFVLFLCLLTVLYCLL